MSGFREMSGGMDRYVDFGPSEPDALGMAALILHGKDAPSAASNHRSFAPRASRRRPEPDQSHPG